MVWVQPVLNEAQPALAYRISEYYLAPLIESLRLMLPVGLSQRGQTVRRTPRWRWPGFQPNRASCCAIPRAQASGLGGDRRRGEARDAAQDSEPLIEMGLVVRDGVSPPPRPKTDRRVRLDQDAGGGGRRAEGLGCKSAMSRCGGWPGTRRCWIQAAAHAEPLWIGRVYAETGATLQTLRDLEAAGLVTVAEEAGLPGATSLAHHEFQLDVKPVPTDDQAAVWGRWPRLWPRD